MTFVVLSNNSAKFMCIRINQMTSHYKDIYIVVFCLLPTTSYYAIHNSEDGDPYKDLHEYITRFSAMGDIIIFGDFNARTRDL